MWTGECILTSYYLKVQRLYTTVDGAKESETGVTGNGVAVPAKGTGINRRTSNKLDVYTIEMIAVLVALRWVLC